MKTFDRRFLFGVLIGALLLLSVMLIYEKFILTTPSSSCNYTKLPDTSMAKNNQVSIESTDFKILNNNIEEKISSINKRYDDLLILGGIVIALLLAINVSVYVKAGEDVDKYLKEHFEEHRKKVLDTADEVKKLLNQVTADAEITRQMKEKTISKQQSPTQ